ncbi:helix-turn-helix domain-containing protein [Streptomyces sp. NPDC090442]|uniref:helix-turn-helix domain-containing protein n=1 Tax=Streptomyces sp. NPDC090442 TaxID=3365962 RepID=UPI00381C4F45
MKDRKPDEPALFAQWLHDQLTARGYDLSGPRSGGRARFAERSGISPSSVGRLLRGDNVTDTRVLGLLAEALGVRLGEVLVRAGVITADELTAVQNPTTGPRSITPEQAADELGIQDPQSRALFLSMTETLRHQRATNGDGHTAEN